MKHTFTTEDLSGSGQYLVKITTGDSSKKSTSLLSSIMYKVGWITNVDKIGGHTTQVSCLISMSDGMVQLGYGTTANRVLFTGEDRFDGKNKLVEYLNKEGYRFATQEEVVRVVLHQSARWRN